MSSLPEDCRVCASCCFSRSPEHVRVHGEDWEKMDDRARDLTVWTANRCYMRIDDGHCAALVVTDIERGLFACGIYDMRPATCRALERGSGACLGELGAKASRPVAMLVRLRRRSD